MYFKAIFCSKIFLVLLSWLSLFSVYFLVLPRQSSLPILYRHVLLHQLGPTAKYSPRCKGNMDDHLNCYFLPGGSQYWIFFVFLVMSDMSSLELAQSLGTPLDSFVHLFITVFLLSWYRYSIYPLSSAATQPLCSTEPLCSTASLTKNGPNCTGLLYTQGQLLMSAVWVPRYKHPPLLPYSVVFMHR